MSQKNMWLSLFAVGIYCSRTMSYSRPVLCCCADRACKGNNDNNRGYIQSPNWPGLYPANIECTWRINPERGRRILIIVPEIHIAVQDHCRDSLVMRQSGKTMPLILISLLWNLLTDTGHFWRFTSTLILGLLNSTASAALTNIRSRRIICFVC